MTIKDAVRVFDGWNKQFSIEEVREAGNIIEKFVQKPEFEEHQITLTSRQASLFLGALTVAIRLRFAKNAVDVTKKPS